MEHLIHNLDEMRDFAKGVLQDINKGVGAKIVALHGDLGAGKTAFVKELAKELGIERHITSPTFVILKKYETQDSNFKILVHIDAYRLESGEDLKLLGWDELSKDPQNLIVVEWPEQVADVLSDDIIKVQFEYVDEETRRITL
ncbi:tRNA (adenosine(37)-N6)-threonylcarbamoyltransferase complex ATPase subunit type 1 TsaE [Patescibacteria group bacterium]